MKSQHDRDLVAGPPPAARRLTSAIGTAALNRGIRAAIPLTLVPVTLSYFGADRYGLWTAAVALTGMLAFGDLGLGHGLMTRLARCCSIGDTQTARRYVSSAYIVLATACCVLCALLWACSSLVPWASIFNVGGSAASSDAETIAVVCLSAYLINAPLSLITSVQYGYRLIVTSNIWQAAGGVTALPLGLAAVWAGLSPAAVVVAIVSGPVLVNLANNVWTFRRSLRAIAPRLADVNRSSTGHLLRLGGLFAALVAIMTAADSADSLIIAHVVDLAAVTAFALPAKVFGVVGALVSLANFPFWPAHGEAVARGDLGWVRRTTRRMTLISLTSGAVLSAMVLLCGEKVLNAWVGGAVGYDQWLFAGLALWWTILAGFSPCFMAQNGAGVVGPQVIGYSLYLVASVATKWIGVSHFGIAAIPYAGVLTYAVTVVPAALVGYRRAVNPSTVRRGRARVVMVEPLGETR